MEVNNVLMDLDDNCASSSQSSMSLSSPLLSTNRYERDETWTPSSKKVGLPLRPKSTRKRKVPNKFYFDTEYSMVENKQTKNTEEKENNDFVGESSQSSESDDDDSDDTSSCDSSESENDFLMQRKQAIADRQRMFKLLDIEGTKNALAEAIKRKYTKREIKKKPNDLPHRPKSERKIKTLVTKENVIYIPEIKMQQVLFKAYSEDDFQKYFADLEQSFTKNSFAVQTDVDLKTCDKETFENEIIKFKVAKNQNLTVLPSPNVVTSLDMHPSSNMVLIACGGEKGYISLWNADMQAEDWDDASGIVFQPYAKNTECVAFSKFHSNILYSCSDDGTVREADLTTKTFDLLYSSAETAEYEVFGVSWLVEQSAGVLYAASLCGNLIAIDKREAYNVQKTYITNKVGLKGVALNPKNNNQLLTSCCDGYISLWDVRKMRNRRLAYGVIWEMETDYKSPAISYSHSGNKILVTNAFDGVCIYETRSNLFETPHKSWEHHASRPHLHRVNRAIWHPQRDDQFYISERTGLYVYECNPDNFSEYFPPKPIVLDSFKLRIKYTFTAFHPSLPILAATCNDVIKLYQ